MDRSLLPDVRCMECLNQSSEHPMSDVLTHTGPLRSDCDEQLIINCSIEPPYAVRLSTIVFESSAGKANRPHSVKVFLNEGNVIFATVDRLAPVDTVVIKWNRGPKPGFDVGVAALPKASRINAFQVSIFVESNASGGSDDVTEITGFDLIGKEATTVGTSEKPQKGG